MKYGYIYKNRPNAQHIISVSKIERLKFSRFKVDFQRNYLDEAEEAVRKNILIQKSRFVAAGNRLADTFELAVNFLADRLDDEIEKLLGVIQPEEGTEEPGLVPFPYSENDVKDISNKLPDEFDWRPRGAVSPVRCEYLVRTLFYKVEPKIKNQRRNSIIIQLRAGPVLSECKFTGTLRLGRLAAVSIEMKRAFCKSRSINNTLLFITKNTKVGQDLRSHESDELYYEGPVCLAYLDGGLCSAVIIFNVACFITK